MIAFAQYVSLEERIRAAMLWISLYISYTRLNILKINTLVVKCIITYVTYKKK